MFLPVFVSAEEKDTVQLHFDVQDTGVGMSYEYLERIWTPFEQADSSISLRFGGTDLGLSLTKTLVDLLGGTISVVSKVDVGTTFSVVLTFERSEQLCPKFSCLFRSGSTCCSTNGTRRGIARLWYE